jgi:hypothetical protein
MSYDIKRDQQGEQELHNEMNELIKEIADEIVNEAKNIVPIKTGALRNSIERFDIGEGSYEIGSVLEYAGLVELGTRNRASTPYLRPALDKVLSKL